MSRALELRAFRRLALAYTVNAIGNWLAEIALVILVYRATGSAIAVVGLMVAGQLLPALVAPALLARLEGRRVLPLLHVLEAVLLASLALLGEAAPLAAVVAVVFADGVLGLAARALVKSAVVAATKPAGLLREANAVLNVSFTVSAAAGPALAGCLTAALGVEAALLIDALTFLLAAAALSCTDIAQRCAGSEPERGTTRARDALAHVAGRLPLRCLLLADAASCVLFAMIIPVEVVYLTETLHSGPAALGTVLTAWGAGAFAGSLLLTRLTRVPVQLVLLAGVLAMACSYLGMAAASSVAAVACCSALGGVGNGIEAFSFLTAIQQATIDRFQTAVNGLVESVHAVAPGVGFLAGGILAMATSPRAVYVAAGATALALTLGAVLMLRAAAVGRYGAWMRPDCVVGA